MPIGTSAASGAGVRPWTAGAVASIANRPLTASPVFAEVSEAVIRRRTVKESAPGTVQGSEPEGPVTFPMNDQGATPVSE